MNRIILSIALIACIGSINAMLEYNYGPHNRPDLATFFAQADYLPTDLPHKYYLNKHGYHKNNYRPKDIGKDHYACECPRTFAPVCCIDNKTYSHSCFASCANIGVKHVGPCKGYHVGLDPCKRCKYRGIKPVCGNDKVSYPNACFAACAGTTIAKETCCCGNDSCCISDMIAALGLNN